MPARTKQTLVQSQAEEAAQRFIFTQSDGHWYLIKVEMEDEFIKWCDWSNYYWDGKEDIEEEPIWEGTDFDSMMIGGHPSLYTFTMPEKRR